MQVKIYRDLLNLLELQPATAAWTLGGSCQQVEVCRFVTCPAAMTCSTHDNSACLPCLPACLPAACLPACLTECSSNSCGITNRSRAITSSLGALYGIHGSGMQVRPAAHQSAITGYLHCRMQHPEGLKEGKSQGKSQFATGPCRSAEVRQPRHAHSCVCPAAPLQQTKVCARDDVSCQVAPRQGHRTGAYSIWHTAAVGLARHGEQLLSPAASDRAYSSM